MAEAANKLNKKERPQFRNIHVLQIVRYRMPLAAIVSILHRISGFLIFLLLPLILYFLDRSLNSPESFDTARRWLTHPFSKLVLLALSWAYFHHFCAGVRHLFLDCHFALDKAAARKTAAAVLVVSVLLTLLIAIKIFGGM